MQRELRLHRTGERLFGRDQVLREGLIAPVRAGVAAIGLNEKGRGIVVVVFVRGVLSEL